MSFEREFFQLAAVWLDCRIHAIEAATDEYRLWYFLGEMDYGAEMGLLVHEKTRSLLLSPEGA